ncbi:MAG TPA: T9SS type A sorting domain-containing protein, partial [Candidatus Eisenbacteria bacterium]
KVSGELVNGSDQSLDFSFTGLPAWLTPSPADGTIEPGQKVQVDFAIGTNLAIGSWNATVTAVARQGATILFQAPLAIRVDVVCVPPTWALNTAEFEQSMTLIAQVTIAGSPATTKDIVAAFVGNQLRGLGHPQVVAGRPDSLLYLTVYSNRTAGETVRFQFFDQSACRVFNSGSKTYAFVADSRIGAPTLPEAITAADVPPGSPQTVPINEGWTWISFNRLSPLDMSVNGVLGDLNSSTGDILKSQSAFSQFDEVAGWVGNVSVFNNLVGYMIRSSEAGQVVLEGNPVPPTQTDIPVVTGWNWISYLPTAEIETNLALATLAPVNGDVIKGQDGFAQYVKTGSVSRWFGSLAKLTPGRGYKLFLSNASNTQNKFRYPNPPVAPSTVGIRQDADLGPLADSGNGPGWTVDPHLFQYNMTVTGTLETDGAAAPAEGDMVAAFVDDELRGTAMLQEFPGDGRRMFFLMIHGNTPSGEAVRLELYNEATDRIYKVDGTVAFEADRVVGNPALPWIGRVTEQAVEPPVGGNVPQAFSLAQNAPNPPNPLTTIRFAMPKSERVSMNVYDVAGRHVMTLVDGSLGAGWHEVTLDSQMFSSGLYFYRLEAGSFVQT